MNVEDCFAQGLLKREMPDAEKAMKSIEIAKHKLALAKRLFGLKIFEETITSSYSSMFHAARALLFREGVKEKSHYALFLYLKEKYSDQLEKKFINELNTLRLERHEISYGLEKVNIKESDARPVLIIVREFLFVVEGLLRK